MGENSLSAVQNEFSLHELAQLMLLLSTNDELNQLFSKVKVSSEATESTDVNEVMNSGSQKLLLPIVTCKCRFSFPSVDRSLKLTSSLLLVQSDLVMN